MASEREMESESVSEMASESDMDSESEMRLEWEDPLKYWQKRSRRALESQGVVVRRRRVHRPPPEVIEIRRRGYQPIGLDLICNNCGQHIPKSTLVHVTIVYFSPYGPVGSLHTRYSTRCMHCLSGLVLGRNIGDVETLFVIAGATAIDEHNLQNEISAKPNLQNEQMIQSGLRSDEHRLLSEKCLVIYPESDSDADSREDCNTPIPVHIFFSPK